MDIDFYNVKSVSDIEKRYKFSQVKGDKFVVGENDYPKTLKVFVPYIDFFISESQPERESFFSKVPLSAISDTYRLIKAKESDLNFWFDNESNKLSNKFIALSLLTMVVEEYFLSRGNIKSLSQKEIKKNIDDLLNMKWG